MIKLDPESIATALDGKILFVGGAGGRHPQRAVIDSRTIRQGDLFFGLRGDRVNGGRYAAAALNAGAWGVVVGPECAEEVTAQAAADAPDAHGKWVFESPDPLRSLQGLATAWRRELGAYVAAITGSVGKTSTKDIARALLGERTHAGRENYNTEIGLPLTVLEAAEDTDHLVLEMAMRGHGQIAELARIAEPDSGAVTNVGPVHTELLGSVDAIARAKAELLDRMRDGAMAVVPADAGPLEPEIKAREHRLEIVRFGAGGDIRAERVEIAPGGLAADIVVTGRPAADTEGEPVARFRFPFRERHNLENALAAIGLGLAAGHDLERMAREATDITLSRYRGEQVSLSGQVTLINDCYNANPISMRAALDHLAESSGHRRIAVLGLMAELGAEAEEHHRDVGEHARSLGIDLIIGVGPEAAWYEPDIEVADAAEAGEVLGPELQSHDVVLVKGSRSARLESVAETVTTRLGLSDG